MAIVALSFGFVILALIVIGAVNELNERPRRRVYEQLLAKFQTGEELSRFLQSPEGQRLLDKLESSAASRSGRGQGQDQSEVVSVMVTFAIVLAFMAGGLGVAAWLYDERINIPGLIVGSVAVGLLIAAFALSRAPRRPSPLRDVDDGRTGKP